MEIAPAVLAAHDGVRKTHDSSSDSSTSTVPVNNNNISSNRYDDGNNEEEDAFRICQNSGDADNPIIYPCDCSRSIKFVHQDCLLQWLNHNNAR
ncbi:unnamed protein product [Lactuca virosa]|uniref:RING-type E3 ubiquitin transferase n=1 Tax=Lactuca virosa TaxID=75947 RepID=A0AAU9PDS1_9ASTR|nr:unnamed protein product [Lactuca virosa]